MDSVCSMEKPAAVMDAVLQALLDSGAPSALARR